MSTSTIYAENLSKRKFRAIETLCMCIILNSIVIIVRSEIG
jgi:hypothetical protein